MRRGVLIAGTVVDAAGQPVPQAAVLFRASPVAVPDVAELTGPDGRFALHAPAAGRYRVAVHADGHAPAEEEVDVAAADPSPLTIVLGGGAAR